MLTDTDIKALNGFLEKHPTWWYTIGVCDFSRDFTTAPQGHSPEAKYINSGNIWDSGFACDHKGTVADAIHQVMEDIECELQLANAKAKYNEAIKQKDSSMQLYWQGVVECLDGSIWGKDNAAE